MNEFVALLKDSSLVSALGATVASRELLRVARDAYSQDRQRDAVRRGEPDLPADDDPADARREPSRARTCGRRHERPRRRAARRPQGVRPPRGAEGHRPRRRRARGAVRDRSVRVREEHAAALREPPRGADVRRGVLRRPAHQRARRRHRPRPDGHRHRLPVVQPLPAQDGARQRDARAREGASASRRTMPRASARGRARSRRPGGQGRRASVPAVGWSAAAGRDRASARDAAEGDALRRGDVRARPRARRRGARGDARRSRATG